VLLMMIWQHPEQASEGGVDQALPLSPGAYSDLVRRGRSFEQLSAFFSEAVNATESGEVNRLHALFVTGELFPMLGVRAAIGRTLGTGDVRPDAAPAVAISHEFWQRQFGGDPGILDRTLDFGGRTREIVGVLPAGFRFSESLVASDPALSKPIDLWAPLNVEDKANERGFHYLTTIARLSPGVSLETAREELEAYAAVAAEQFPDTDAGYGLSALSLRDQIFGSLRPALLTLGAATLILVLIACVNLATVLLARMYKKRRDTAVRLALGADRPRIVREWLSQSVALSLAGGAVSLCVAFVAIRVLTGLQPVEVFRSYPPRIGPEVILFTFGASLTAGLLFGTMPALLASRTDFPTAMRAGTTRLTGRSRLAFVARLAVVRSGMSPYVTTTRGASPRAGAATCNAWPVPSCGACRTTCKRSSRPTAASSARAARSTSPAPCPTTSTMRSGSRPSAASSTQPSIGRPQSSWSTFGRSLFMRVPLPAASTTTVVPEFPDMAEGLECGPGSTGVGAALAAGGG
jgi:predicted permease